MPAPPLTLFSSIRIVPVAGQEKGKGKDENLGWLPNLKGKYTEFFISIYSAKILPVGSLLGFESNKFQDNPAVAGRFMEEKCNPK